MKNKKRLSIVLVILILMNSLSISIAESVDNPGEIETEVLIEDVKNESENLEEKVTELSENSEEEEESSDEETEEVIKEEEKEEEDLITEEENIEEIDNLEAEEEVKSDSLPSWIHSSDEVLSKISVNEEDSKVTVSVDENIILDKPIQINIPSGKDLLINGNGNWLKPADNLNIDNYSSEEEDRMIFIFGDGDVEVKGLNFNGLREDPDGPYTEGQNVISAIYNDSKGKLTIKECELRNLAMGQKNIVNKKYEIHGGGIYSKGPVEVEWSIFENIWNSRFGENGKYPLGGVIYSDSDITIKDGSRFFRNGYKEYAIEVRAAEGTIAYSKSNINVIGDNMGFTKNYISSGNMQSGYGLFVTDKKVYVEGKNITFMENEVGMYGGEEVKIVGVENGGKPSISFEGNGLAQDGFDRGKYLFLSKNVIKIEGIDIEVKNNVAALFGDVTNTFRFVEKVILGSKGVDNNISFINNKTVYGNQIIAKELDIIGNNIRFEGNSVGNDAFPSRMSGIVATKLNMSGENIVFDNNSGLGEAYINVLQRADISGKNIYFKNNSPKNMGGLNSSGGILKVNGAGFNTGGSRVDGALNLSGENIYFVGNNASYGGAVMAEIVNLTGKNIVFANNTAIEGGAILQSRYTDLSKFYLDSENVIFYNNKAEKGGAICTDDFMVEEGSKNSLMINNTAKDGSAIYINRIDKSNLFEDNGYNDAAYGKLLIAYNRDGSENKNITINKPKNISLPNMKSSVVLNGNSGDVVFEDGRSPIETFNIYDDFNNQLPRRLSSFKEFAKENHILKDVKVEIKNWGKDEIINKTISVDEFSRTIKALEVIDKLSGLSVSPPGENDIKILQEMLNDKIVNETIKSESIKFIANWEPNFPVEKVKVTFDANSGKFADGNNKKEVTIDKGTQVTKIAEVPTRVGYTFKHWSEKDASVEFDFTTSINEDKVLNAVWEKEVVPVEKVKLIFDLKNGELPTELGNLQFFKDKLSNGKITFVIDKNTSIKDNLGAITEGQAKLFEDKIERRNYTFRGWKYNKLNTSFNFSTKIGEDTEVFADWYYNGTPSNKVRITFDANRGEFKNGDTEKREYIDSGEKYRERDMEKPRRSGYTFKGWTDDKSREKLFDFDKRIYNDLTLYAVWERDDDRDRDKDRDKPKEPSRVIEKVEKLNREDHFEYIQGYEDNSIRPEANITREEVAAVFYRLLGTRYKNTILTDKNNFIDKQKITWSNKHVSTLAKGKILEGYQDNSFRPTNNITRAEVAVIASRFDNLSTTKNSFKDVQGHWAEKYIGSAVAKGWIKGYPDGNFKPDEYITRAEFVSLVNNVLDRKVKMEDTVTGIKQYKDLKSDKWYYADFVEATNGHIYEKLRNTEVWKQLKKFNFDM